MIDDPRALDEDARDAVRAMKVADQMELERAKREARRRLDAEERGPTQAPEILTLHDFLAQPDPPVPWRIAGWQPSDSRLMVAAQFKSGKTTLRDNLTRSLADGDFFLGSVEVRPVVGTVAIVDTEMSPTQARRWLRDQRIRHTDRVVLALLRGQAAAFNLLSPETRAQWADWFRQRNVRYLITDCLRPVLDALGLDEHRDAGRFLVGVDALLRDAEIPEAAIIHHMGHVGERSRGDSRLIDWPDVTVKLVRQDDNPASPRYISAYGRDVDQPESRLEYDPLVRRLTLVGGSRHDARLDGVLDAVVEVLDASPTALSGRKVKEALADSEHSKDTIDAALKAGVRNGRLRMEHGPSIQNFIKCPAVSVHCPPDSHRSQCPSVRPPL
jgi:AAA domain-containing protein